MLPLAIALTVLAYAIVPLVDSLTLRWFVRDLDTRSNLLASTLRDPLLEAMSASDTARIASLFNTAVQDQRLYAMALCDPRQRMLVKTELYPAAFGCEPLAGRDPVQDQVIALPQGSLHVASIPLSIPGETARGSLIVVHDMSFIERRSEDTRL